MAAMQEHEYSSALFAQAVEAFTLLPGVGRKSAERFLLHLLGHPEEERARFVTALSQCVHNIKHCPGCHGYSDDGGLCSLCSDPRREEHTLCVVADVRDVMALERAQHYRGRYFVLGGLIDPIAGLGPDQLAIEPLLRAAQQPAVQEIIIALSSTMEGETTTYYLQRRLQPLGRTLSVPARGIAFGESIEQTDEITLSRAFQNRLVLTPVAEGQPTTQVDSLQTKPLP